MTKGVLGGLAYLTIAMVLIGDHGHSAALAATTSEQAVLDRDHQWAIAETKRDGAALQDILDDRFIATFGTAKPVDKKSFIKLILSGDATAIVTQDLSDRTIVVDHDTAVLIETDTVRKTKANQTTETVYRITLTYIRRAGRWVALAEHIVAAKR